MRRILPSFLVCLVLFGPSIGLRPAHAQTAGYSRVNVYALSEAQWDILRSLDVDHMVATGDGAMRCVVSRADLERLRAAGIRTVVEIDDLERFYAERARADRARVDLEGSKHASRLQSTPENFALGSVGGFFSPEELEAELRRMAQLYPDLVSMPERIGTTHQGRPILATRISARSANDPTVPEALFTAMHHAREPAGMMSLVYSMWSLVESYGSDPESTYLLDNRALWFIPLVNVDGYARNVELRPTGGGLWRKNMRAEGDSGVDLNRNYGPMAFWNHAVGGSSLNRNSDTYRGPAPFSEPETQAMRDFCLQHRFAVALNHHTFSNLFIQPEEVLTLPPADSVYYRNVTRALGALAGYAPGNSKVTVGYVTRGTSDDWMYANGRVEGGHIFSWTPESGNGDDEFWPAPSRIEPICAWNHRMNIGIAWAAGPAPMITARTWRTTPNGPVVRVTVMNVGRVAMTGPGSLALADGDSTSVPALAPSEALTFELPVPAAYATAPKARPMIDIVLSYETSRIVDSIAPIAHRVDTLLVDDFESGIGRWDPTFAWGIEATMGHTRVASDSPGGIYAEREEVNELVLRTPVALQGYSAAELFFDARYAVEARNHNAMIQIRRGSSLLWEDVDCEELQLPFETASTKRNRFRGDMLEWRRYRVCLDEVLGETVTIRFAVAAHTSMWHYTYDGLMIDNVELVASRPVGAAVDREAPAAALRVMPNPFGSHLSVELAAPARSATVELYDALGALVRARSIESLATIETEDLPAGAYTLVVRRGDEVMRRRVMLVR